MSARLRSLLIHVAVVLAASITVYAQDSPAGRPAGRSSTDSVSIFGRVVLPSGHPISNSVRVTLSNLADEIVSIYTDNNGNFSFTNLSPGTYSLEVSGDSKTYDPVTEQVRLIRGMRANLVIPLKERTATKDAKSAGNVVAVAELEQKVPDAAKKEFEKATELARSGKREQAIPHFRKAISIFPSYIMARNDLGVQHLYLKQYPEAAEQFEAAIEISPKSLYPRLNLGITFVEQKRFTEAIDQLSQALSIDGSSASAHLYMGIASAETDQLEAAERELAAALTLGGPEHSVAHFHKAQVHMKKGERDAAIGELKTYLEKAPTGEHASRAKELLQILEQS